MATDHATNRKTARQREQRRWSALRQNPEFQSALVRSAACLFGAAYIGLGAWTHYYRVDLQEYLGLFAGCLLSNFLLLVSVIRRPDWPARRLLATCLDVVTASLAIFITREAISPFYLLYILIFISAGTRFGKLHLIVAAVVAVIAYNFVLIELDEWRRHTFEAAFFLLLLVLLPLYQAALLRQVQQAREDAERANRARGDFLAHMTHELRIPLTGVSGMVELLRDTQLNLEQRDYLEAISLSAETLNTLIGDILDFSKIDARQLRLEHIPFDPRAIVHNVCGILARSTAMKRGLEIICHVDPEVPDEMLGDPVRVAQILYNLLGNALKFTEQGEVSLRVSACAPDTALSSPYLLLAIADTGIGIPQDRLYAVFESFCQADDSTARRFGGSGLGMTIARELTLLMGGQIAVESEEGCGSCFRVKLPLLGDDWVCAGPPPAAGRLRGLRILAVEPNRTQRALIGAMLEREQAVCHSVAELPETVSPELWEGAADASGEDGIALAILSETSAGRDDLEHAVIRLREALDERLPCLLLTYPGHQRQTLPPGVVGLNKPFLAEDLLGALDVALGRAPAALAERADRQDKPWRKATRSIRVLVAEDNELAATVLVRFLTKMGFAYQLFQDGETALTAALNGGYQIAIVDYHMPTLDGVSFTRRYRQLAADRPLPIVALTATALADVKQQCLDVGMDGFLIKPVSPHELHRIIERLALPEIPDVACQTCPAPATT